jgi:hypothetical protein
VNRAAEDLWWFEDRQGIVAFPVPEKIWVERYYPENCWLVKADGKTYHIPMETVENRRYWVPLFNYGRWHDGGWALGGFAKGGC